MLTHFEDFLSCLQPRLFDIKGTNTGNTYKGSIWPKHSCIKRACIEGTCIRVACIGSACAVKRLKIHLQSS